MGSYAEESVPPQEDEITVLVTGFGPFRAQNPINPSWEIASRLPPFLPPSTSSHSATSLSALSHPRVRILTHPTPIRVSYTAVRALIPSLWAQDRKIDYAIHIGMASGRQYYSVERRGHRDGYKMADVDGELLGDEERKAREGEAWVWDGMPAELESSVDVGDVWKRWRVGMPNTDLRISEDAGRYLCDFIYFSSLAHLTKRNEDRRVVFLHVPVWADEEAVRKGVEVTVELIRAIVDSGRMKKITGQVAGEGREVVV